MTESATAGALLPRCKNTFHNPNCFHTISFFYPKDGQVYLSFTKDSFSDLICDYTGIVNDCHLVHLTSAQSMVFPFYESEALDIVNKGYEQNGEEFQRNNYLNIDSGRIIISMKTPFLLKNTGTSTWMSLNDNIYLGLYMSGDYIDNLRADVRSIDFCLLHFIPWYRKLCKLL